jgi:hypothetical protein
MRLVELKYSIQYLAQYKDTLAVWNQLKLHIIACQLAARLGQGGRRQIRLSSNSALFHHF